jgi:type I restriction enzyme S subunit
VNWRLYPDYRPSGDDVLGEIPQSWRAKPLKRVTSFNDDVLPETTDPDYQIEYVDISNVSAERGIEGTEVMPFAKAPSRARRTVEDGDVIISTVRTYLKAIAPIRHPPHNMVVSTGFAVVRPRNELQPAFAAYMLHANYFMDEVVAHSVGVSYPAINASEMACFKVPLPPIKDQGAITGFLDRETAKLDTLIAKQERLIELLQEKRQAVISHAVTKGLNPDAPMKDSGVEWLGEVPAHWNIEKFSRAVQIAEGQVDPEVEPYSSMRLVAPNHIESRTGRVVGVETAAEQGAISGKYFCGRGDVIYSKIRPGLAKATVASEDCLCSADMYPMRPRGELRGRFLLLLLLSSQFTAWSVLEADRVAMPKINRETLNDLRLPLPPIDEQDEIVDCVERKATRIDGTLMKVAKSIDLMREHRSALISAAVTGKIDVRAEALTAASEQLVAA